MYNVSGNWFRKSTKKERLFRRAGLVALVVALSIPSISHAESSEPMVGIAPLEGDLESMRRTLRRLRKSIDERRPNDIVPLISPRISGPHRQAIISNINNFSDSLPDDCRYELRTEITRASLVPLGPELMQFHIRGTKVTNGERIAGMVHVQIESVELEGRRQWLFNSLTFPGQRTLIVGGIPWFQIVTAIGIVLFLAIVFLVWRRRRRQTKMNES